MVRFVLVAYCAGVMLGVLGLIEWLVSRIARAWLRDRRAEDTRVRRRIAR